MKTRSDESRFFVPAVLLMVLYFTAAMWKIDQDDAFIFYRYARNLASGLGFVYNPGERILGVTSPLYTLLLAFLTLVLKPLGLASLPAISKILGAACLFGSLLVGSRIVRDAGYRRAAILFPFAFLVSAPISAATGMETFPAILLALVAVRFHQREQFTPMAVSAALAVLARPDQGLLFLLLLGDVLLRRRPRPIGALLAGTIMIAGWALFCRFYFGTFLPNTLGAKLAQTASGRWGSGFIFFKGLATSIRPTVWVLFGGSALMLAVDRIWRGHRSVALLLLWQVLHLVAYGFALNPPAYIWYYVPVGLGVGLVIALGLDVLLARLDRSGATWAHISLVGASVLLALGALVAPTRLLHKPASAKAEIYRRAAAWLNEAAPEGSSVGANEIGIVGFYYIRGPIVDAMGLVTPGVADHVRRREYDWYVHAYGPDFLLFNDPPREDLEAMANEPWFARRYDLATVVRTDRRSVRLYRARPSSAETYGPDEPRSGARH